MALPIASFYDYLLVDWRVASDLLALDPLLSDGSLYLYYELILTLLCGAAAMKPRLLSRPR